MLELLSNPNVWAAFATLTVMEVVLGIDNIVFISVLVSRLPKEQSDRARKLGLALALVFRILLLLVISWIIALKDPVINDFGLLLSWKDIILVAGGAFLIYKATHEMHAAIEEPHEEEENLGKQSMMAFGAIIAQIIVIDLVFSIDSIITAVGMADHVEVMIAAVIVAVGLMFIASGPIAAFVARHPTTKMLALAFLLLIGVSLVVDGFHDSFGFEVPKAYIYSAMAFAVLVESINNIANARRDKRRAAAKAAKGGGHAPVAVTTGALAAEAAGATAAVKPKGKSAAARAQARPKSAPRIKK